MTDWPTVYENVLSVTRRATIGVLFFRGHCRSDWPLLPSLGRCVAKVRSRGWDLKSFEEALYSRFVTRAGSLLPDRSDSWATLFTMQHHGVPTRLLDWTRTFAVALHFAVAEADGDAAVWVLDPYDLNETWLNRTGLPDPSELPATYSKTFLSKDSGALPDVIALDPFAEHPRVLHQHSGFTLHSNLDVPLEVLHPGLAKKIVIPRSAHEGAKEFLELSGISAFSLFPDLDGLAREIRETFEV